MSDLFNIAIILILLALLTLGVYQKITNAKCLSTRKLKGETVIVTGGTAGMGLVMATDLASRGARVIIACPFHDEGINARELIIKKTGNKNVIFKYLDQASFKSVREFATDILNTEERLDILINNAAVGFPKEILTPDGMNIIMQVNYFGPFLLTMLLLPLLKKTGRPGKPTRILMTSSVLHFLGKIDISNLNSTTSWTAITTYGNSKLCVAEFTRQLDIKLKDSNVVINTVDPGAVGTKIFDSLNIVMGFILNYGCKILFKTAWQGVQTALHVALDTKAGNVSGQYFKNCEVSHFVRSVDKITSNKLWEESVRLVKLTTGEINTKL